MKVERGVMVMKYGKGWGLIYDDGQSTHHGWMDPEDAPIHDPMFCKSPTDVTWNGSPYIKELMTAGLVEVERITAVNVLSVERVDAVEREAK